jgi:hypothetical protein
LTQLLDRALRNKRSDLLIRAAAGEQTAAFQLFGLPWSLEGLGPSLDNPELLQRIERTVLRPTGNPVAFADNESIKWIETAADLEAAFLSSVRDTQGRLWSDFEDEVDGIWCSIAALAWEVEERPEASSAPLEQLFRIVSQTEKSTLAFLDLAWADAFATGRVLVIECINEDWRFRAPEHWRHKPPFAATAARRSLQAATRGHRTVREKLTASLLKEDASSILAPFGNLARAFDLFGDFAKPPLPASVPIFDVDLPTAPQRLGEPAQRPSQRLYLLSGQLSEKLRSPASFKGVGPRSREVARLEKALVVWFRSELVHQRRMTREAAWAAIAAEAKSRTGIADGWGKMAKRVWDECAPDEWRRAGRPRRRAPE